MLININQKTSGLLPEIQKYGCLFLCFAEMSPFVFEGTHGISRLNSIWQEAVKDGVITGDLNTDGDVDDEGEAEIQDHQRLLNNYFGCRLYYDGTHHKASEEIPYTVRSVIGKFFWKSGHFVLLNLRKEVIFDPMGYSNTVKNGKLQTMRWYYAD